jgi:hypothetical protein
MVRRRDDSSAWHSSFYRHAWIAIAKVGLPGIYLQDLRHAGNTSMPMRARVRAN